MNIVKSAIFASLLIATTSNTALAANTQMSITVSNKASTLVTPSSPNYAGTVAPTPIALAPSTSQFYVNTGLGNVTSFHIDYANTTGKKCHFDAASFNQSTVTSPCKYTKAAQSTGSGLATCTATITQQSSNPANCAFSITFEIR